MAPTAKGGGLPGDGVEAARRPGGPPGTEEVRKEESSVRGRIREMERGIVERIRDPRSREAPHTRDPAVHTDGASRVPAWQTLQGRSRQGRRGKQGSAPVLPVISEAGKGPIIRGQAPGGEQGEGQTCQRQTGVLNHQRTNERGVSETKGVHSTRGTAFGQAQGSQVEYLSRPRRPQAANASFRSEQLCSHDGRTPNSPAN